jgi:hypothetical protein
MKKLIFTHLFLNLYLLALVQPAIPILEYLINYDYIVNELCENRDKPILSCNGKCYLGDQLDLQPDHSSEQQLPLPPKVDLEKFISLVKDIPNVNLKAELSKDKLPEYHDFLKEKLFSDTPLKPPIA